MIYKTGIEKLKNHDLKHKYGFSINYKIGHGNLYVLGGKYVGGRERLSDLQSVYKFNIYTLKWSPFPKMCQKRYQPGTFISPDGKYLYAFGGDSSSVERIDLQPQNEKE